MGLDQAGDHRLPFAVDDPHASRRLDAPHLRDAVALDQHVAADHGAARVHGHHRAAAEQDHSSSRRSTLPVTRER